ncbi:MAG: NifU family protein [Promethearchaeota archaeon]
MRIKMDKEKVKQVIEKIRPQLQMDGGDVELVEITDDGIVKVRLQGHCVGCVHAQQTLQWGIERAIKQFVPEVKQVVGVP